MVIKVFATFRQIISGKEVNVEFQEGWNVRQLLAALIEKYPAFEEELFDEKQQLLPHNHVFVNGRNIIHEGGLDLVLSPQDEIALFPPVGGG